MEQTPQGFFAVFLAPIDGFYDHISYEAQAVDVAVFILMIGGFLGVVNSTGACSPLFQTLLASLYFFLCVYVSMCVCVCVRVCVG